MKTVKLINDETFAAHLILMQSAQSLLFYKGKKQNLDESCSYLQLNNSCVDKMARITHFV